MSPSPSDAFFEGRGIPVELAEVEDALDQLWGPAAEKAGGPELDNPAVTRVALANVVLVLLGPDRLGLDETIEAITTQYPSRLILLRPSDEGGRRLIAEVSAQCHLPSPGRPQVCSEQIILRAGPESLDLLPGAVRSLRESDLHSVLWWCDDPRRAPDLLDQLAEGSTRVILDLPDPDADPAGLAWAATSDRSGLSRDIAWFGLTPWRELIAGLFDLPASSDPGRVASIRVRALAASLDRPPRAAAWLVGWFAGQLGWTPVGSPSPLGPGSLEATLRGPGGDVAVRIETERADVGPLARIDAVELGMRGDHTPDGTLLLHRTGPETCEVLAPAGNLPGPTSPRLVATPEYDVTRRISAALLTDRNDPPYRRSLPIVLWILGIRPANDQGRPPAPRVDGRSPDAGRLDQ